MGNDVLTKFSSEDIVRMAKNEIELAKKAQINGKQLPELTFISFILFTRSFDRLPQSIWQDLSFLLMKVHRGKRGRPSTEQEDLELAKKYFELRSKDKKDAETITILAGSRNHGDERSTRRALARGKKLYEQELEKKAMLWRESLLEKGISPSGTLADLLKLAEYTDKKE